MNKKKIFTILISIGVLLISAGLIAMLFSSLRSPQPKTPTPETKRFVKAKKVTYSDIESFVTGAGRLASIQQVDVIAEVQGKILPGDVPMKKGQPFKKNDLLFRIFDKEAQLGLLAKKSRFLNAIANLLPDFKVDFPKSYPGWTTFLGSIDIKKELPSLPEIKSPKEKIFLAGRSILSDYYSIKSEEVRLKKYSVHAPFSGTYTEVNLEVGSVANTGSRLGKIIRTDSLELEVPIEVDNADWINTGDNVRVTSEDGSKEWKGTVTRKSQFVDSRTQSISVFVGVRSTKENPLYLGLYLKAIFPGILVKNAMQIPRNAVFNKNEVFAVVDGRLAKKEITIRKIDAKTLIFSGLPEGLEIVTEPLVNATENSLVQILDKDSKKKNDTDGKQSIMTAEGIAGKKGNTATSEEDGDLKGGKNPKSIKNQKGIKAEK